jgi:hypothetical protein
MCPDPKAQGSTELVLSGSSVSPLLETLRQMMRWEDVEREIPMRS